MHYCVKGIYIINSSVQAMEICNTWSQKQSGAFKQQKCFCPNLNAYINIYHVCLCKKMGGGG